MTKQLPAYILLLYLFACFSCQPASQNGTIVKDLAAFKSAVKQAKAGDRIILANGVWKDVELVFTGQGTEEAPITLSVESKGKVTLEGQSNLRIAGEFLVVEGLVFKNGYTPTNEVISFRRNKENLANHCRITECVIDNYSNPERFESDYWVGIYGKNNRFDHNYMVGKSNQGVTLAVRLNSEESRENHHQIDHNYFGYRPILGSNGGETLRIGTSHYSLTNSNTIVEYNYFDRCNGEHEIISNKSCQNTFRYNTFNECQGTLTMRHGNETLVESNYFFGNGKANTGGIRIINESQTVINNYCVGLTGYRFRGALVIMNGVPNSPLNRYNQVIDSEASNNTFIDCDYIQLCAGSDEERSATPQSTKVLNNLFYSENRPELFTVYDDISGIEFAGNLISEDTKRINDGFKQTKLSFAENESGLLQAKEAFAEGVGMTKITERATPENCGPSWYPIVEQEVRFGTGKVIPVSPGINTLVEAAKTAQTGDVLELSSGDYVMAKAIDLHVPISIRAAANLAQKPKITFERSSLFNLENGASLKLQGLEINGEASEDKAANTVIRTSRYSMNRNYKLIIEDCEFLDLDVNHSFNVLRVYKNTFADSIVLRNSLFRNISGHVLKLDKETDDIGIYNAENVVLENCVFQDIEGVALDLHRGGRDESTFGPILDLDHCTFRNVGHGKRNKANASIALHGVQLAKMHNSIFDACKPMDLFLAVGEPVIKLGHCNFYETPAIRANDDAYQTYALSNRSPEFASEEGYELSAQSPLLKQGQDGKKLGVLW
ncbi:MAG: chondroitinase-B domain-containing protein [Bacteroidota bacterium]